LSPDIISAAALPRGAMMGHDDHGHETLSFIEALDMCASIASGDGPKSVLLGRLCCRRRDIRRVGG
jgi:hypothetical protein